MEVEELVTFEELLQFVCERTSLRLTLVLYQKLIYICAPSRQVVCVRVCVCVCVRVY